MTQATSSLHENPHQPRYVVCSIIRSGKNVRKTLQMASKCAYCRKLSCFAWAGGGHRLPHPPPGRYIRGLDGCTALYPVTLLLRNGRTSPSDHTTPLILCVATPCQVLQCKIEESASRARLSTTSMRLLLNVCHPTTIIQPNYGTRGNSCNKNAHFFLSPLSPNAVSLRPCGARSKLSRVLLWSHGVRLELDIVLPWLRELCLKRSRVLLRLHMARLGLDRVLLWPHTLVG